MTDRVRAPQPSRLRWRTPASVAVAACVAGLLVGASPASATPAAGADGSALAHRPSAAARALAVRRELQTAQAAHARTVERARLLHAHAHRLSRQAAVAAAQAEVLRRRLAHEPVGSVVSAVSSLFTDEESTADHAADAAANEEHARQLLGLARSAAAQADRDVLRTDRTVTRARRAAAGVQVALAAREAARAAAAQARLSPDYRPVDAGEDRQARTSLRGWLAYLNRLADAAVVPPPADALADPSHLPSGLRPLLGRRGRPLPGMAELPRPGRRSLPVLSAETIAAVSRSFHLLGTNDPDLGPTAYACGGFAAAAWSPARADVPADAVAQWTALRAVPTRDLQIGDLAYLDGQRTAVTVVGVYVGHSVVIAPDPETGLVSAGPLDRTAVRGARRVLVPARARMDRSADSPVRCSPPAPAVIPPAAAVPETTALPADHGWLLPVAPGSYVLTAGFDSAGGLWSSGRHTGQDFAVPVGTPVRAARAGVATVEHPAWAGNLVRIDHGDGYETWYAHLSAATVQNGERVKPGALVGLSGDRGNSTGPHLHFEVRFRGEPIDPMRVLRPSTTP